MEWLSAVQRMREAGDAGVLVTIISSRGHAPRAAGAKMLVTAHHSWDSIGGGNLEATAIDRAREMLLAETAEPQTMDMSLNEHATTRHGRQCCGGQVTLLLEPILSPPPIAIFGLGHVGRELAGVLSRMNVRLYLADSREEFAEASSLPQLLEAPANVSWHHTPAPEALLRELPQGTHVVIMTHDHAEDLFLCEAALNHAGLASTGLIGSAAKWTRFRKRLRESGYEDSAIDRITCPIGIPEITGKSPAVIALSIASSLVQDIPQELL
jgi:xanthine dehydrogenase accessory factor